MLAFDGIGQGLVIEPGNPTHYENRLTADLGDLLGFNKDDIRRATLDEHARQRFPCLKGPTELLRATARCQELFDFGAFLKAFMAEINGFNADSSADSLPRLFLDWA